MLRLFSGTGAEVVFNILSTIAGQTFELPVFTTRPDTLFGATYMVLAPEHPLVEKISTEEQHDAVATYVREAKNKSDLQRSALEKEDVCTPTSRWIT